MPWWGWAIGGGMIALKCWIFWRGRHDPPAPFDSDGFESGFAGPVGG